ncbi:hypothetical protein [Streptomyces sp. NPDC047061]|uniref:hypothetical protein n=1 Tax=Streptomyces sp. NPDC047061 TaxID=3154605 RepID=UPI0033C90E41
MAASVASPAGAERGRVDQRWFTERLLGTVPPAERFETLLPTAVAHRGPHAAVETLQTDMRSG